MRLTFRDNQWPDPGTMPTPVFQPPPDFTMLQRQFAQTGIAVSGPPALSHPVWQGLYREARLQLRERSWSLTGQRTQGEIDQNNRRAHLGPMARNYLLSPAVRDLLGRVTGASLTPRWSASCYTFYQGPGQHMGEHCDKRDACTFALLTWLHVRWPASRLPGPGLQLFVCCGDRAETGLVARVSSHSNRIAILNGAEQAHFRPALAVGEEVVLLAGCFGHCP